MNAKEKAIDLFNKFLKTDEKCTYSFVGDKVAKQCALIAVDEIINSSPSLPILGDGGYFSEDIEVSLAWWKEVRQQIELLKF
jgi:hypothetical protein